MKLKLRQAVTVCTVVSTMALAQMTNLSGNTQVMGKGSVTSFDFPGAINTQATASRHRETSWAGTPARTGSSTDSC